MLCPKLSTDADLIWADWFQWNLFLWLFVIWSKVLQFWDLQKTVTVNSEFLILVHSWVMVNVAFYCDCNNYFFQLPHKEIRCWVFFFCLMLGNMYKWMWELFCMCASSFVWPCLSACIHCISIKKWFEVSFLIKHFYHQKTFCFPFLWVIVTNYLWEVTLLLSCTFILKIFISYHMLRLRKKTVC